MSPAAEAVPGGQAEAIVSDADAKAGAWIEKNRELAALWPNISRKGTPPEDADAWKDRPDKAGLLSEEPGTP